MTRGIALPLPLQFLLACCIGWLNRQQQAVIEYLQAENAVLHEALGGSRPHLTDAQRRRLARAGQPLGRAALAQVATIVTPDTILRWFRTLVAKKYDGTLRRRPGRPRTKLADLILRFARENPTWGYTRIRDAVENLKREVSRATVARGLKENGIEPAPERRNKTPWREFLAAHWDAFVAADFFTVEVFTWMGLVRYHVLFFMELKTRRVYVAGISRDPSAEWLMQIARNVTDAFDGFLRNGTYLILDRDPIFSLAFRRLLGGHDVNVVRLPARSPNLNAFAERWVRSIREECLDRIIPLGEAHLRRAVSSYVAHYHRERNHQGLESRLIDPEPLAPERGRVACRVRLGGLLKYYYRLAA